MKIINDAQDAITETYLEISKTEDILPKDGIAILIRSRFGSVREKLQTVRQKVRELKSLI
ncbi:MAG: hypothetical protein Q8L47_03540 [bacterium]|nr:hypothetical protein [bacterium]